MLHEMIMFLTLTHGGSYTSSFEGKGEEFRSFRQFPWVGILFHPELQP